MRAGSKRPPFITSDLINSLIADTSLPNPAEQAENFIVWLGESLTNRLGDSLRIDYERDFTRFGSPQAGAVPFLVRELSGMGLLRPSSAEIGQHCEVGLTLPGWERFEAIRRGRADSKRAFMAMKFGDALLESIYRECFRPAALRAGFHLETMDENPSAGSLIQRMRLEIRRARFVVADLTHGNRGAYWEAGFAEGLRRPVIYACEKGAFETTEKAHFDVGQEQHVIWEADKLDEAAERLTLTIRNSLPDEATLEDKPERK
jgi:hypothetical protein